MAIPYINIHRHGPAELPEFGIENIYKNFGHPPSSHFSAGLHPWHIEQDSWKEDFIELKKLVDIPAMLAVGECGLDKICKTDYALQKDIFIAQVQWANYIHKPLIIHCVRAYEDVMKCLETAQNRMPAIFHGFNKSLELAERLLSKGYYLSFGKSLQQEHMQAIFKKIPHNRIFLETDDAALDIEAIYTLAAAASSVPADTLSLQLKKNLHTVFNILV
jgi:TatD DNase family protein